MKRRIWIKVALWVVLTPILLFAFLMVLLYVPPVQNFIREKATAVASEATGMEISIRRIDLHFPLNLRIRDVQVAQRTDTLPTARLDTLLTLGTLDVRIQAMPLFHGQVEIDQILLKQVGVNSLGLIEGMTLKGELGSFLLQSHGVDLLNETVILNRVDLADTHLSLVLADTTQTPPDTTTTVLNWKIALHNLSLKNVSVDLDMPLDTMSLRANIPQASIEDADVDLGRNYYGWRRFGLEGASVSYDTGTSAPVQGFDAAHLALRDLHINIDSVMTCGHDMNGVIRKFTFNERSGLHLSSLTGRFSADSSVIRIPYLQLRTPHSEIDLSAQTYWELVEIPTTGRLTARLDARIGKQDMLLFAGGLPESFKEAYPFRPLVIRAGTVGNLKEMQISRLMVDLPGAFSIDGGGGLWNLTDSVNRCIGMDLNMHTYDLNFLTALSGEQPDGSIVVPDSMDLMANVSLEGAQCNAVLKLNEQQGSLDLNAAYNLDSEEYMADLVIDSLHVDHFLPKDSIYMLTASLSAKGKGVDFTSNQAISDVRFRLAEIQYGSRWNISNVALDAGLKSSVVGVKLSSDNPLLKMQTRANLHLDRAYLDGKVNMDVDDVNLYQLGVIPEPLEYPFAFNLGAEARRDSIKLYLDAGDLAFRFRARSTLKELMDRSSVFASLLAQQVKERRLDHAALRRVLPSAGMQLTAGTKNPMSYFLHTQNISYDDFVLRFGFTPTHGINGQTVVRGLRTDSLLLDTIFFVIAQDTTRMKLQGGVVNGPDNPQFVFRSTLTGEIRNEDAELTVQYVDDKGDTGILFGLNARPLTEGHGKGNGVLVRLLPEEPVIAYRKFRFVDNKNSIYLHKNMRVYADIDMDEEDNDMGFRMQSDIHDTVSLQNINIELSRFRLDELSEVMPYLPRLSGLFSAQAHYIQTPTSLEVSASANVDSLTYERRWVGNVGAGATWLPESGDKHRLHAYFSNDQREVLTADGLLAPSAETQEMEVKVGLDKFPLSLANAFIPDRMAMMRGELNGEVSVKGTMDKPTVNGELAFDTASVYIRQLGARYWFDSRPIRVENNVVSFDNFSLYTTSRNPFMITGSVDLRDMARPTADIRLFADNYTLLDAKRRRSSIVYGKVVVSVNAFVRGPLDALTMRGSMNLLGSTNVTYILTDSPLTVEDRLDGLVTFVSFSDTTSTAVNDVPTVSLGGMDVSLVVGIDDAVRLRADLTPDGSKYVELEGGGNLTLQLTPQGDMTLMGRYTLSGGTMKYSLPIIPLKEFKLTSGSYVDWRGDVMDPLLSLKATERIRSSVDDGNGTSRPVDFDVSIGIGGRLSAPDLAFDLVAPEDATIQNELQAMGSEERSKQAIAMMATGIYLASSGGGSGLSMGSALNSVLQSQINSLAGSVKGASISVGIEDRTSAETGDTQKDFSFKYSQRFFNDRIQVNIGGKVSTGANATNNAESFIDNISLEYRLDASGTRYVRAFYYKNNESILDGEITETGAGLVLRRKMDKLSELFIFRRKKPVREEGKKKDENL